MASTLSLSRLLKSVRSEISTLTSGLSALTNRFSTSYNANAGDNLKIDSSGKINCEKIIKLMRAATDNSDISSLSTQTVSMKEMFSSWKRISCGAADGASQNDSSTEQVLARSSYYYDNDNDVIICSRNSDAYSAFISEEKYPTEYTLNYRMDQRYAPNKGGDNDLLQYVIAYMVDSNGKFHTLSLSRMSGTSEHNGHSFVLAYDLYTAWVDTSKSKIILGEVNAGEATWYNNYTLCQVKRTATTIECLTAAPNQDTLNENYKISWTLPTKKPDDWSQEMFDNITYMMGNRCQVGFGTQSNISAFRVDSQSGLFDEIIVYDLTSGEKKTYKDGAVIKTESTASLIEPNTIIYSMLNEKLFFYSEAGLIVDLLHQTEVDSMKKQILELQNTVAELVNKVNSNWS